MMSNYNYRTDHISDSNRKKVWLPWTYDSIYWERIKVNLSNLQEKLRNQEYVFNPNDIIGTINSNNNLDPDANFNCLYLLLTGIDFDYKAIFQSMVCAAISDNKFLHGINLLGKCERNEKESIELSKSQIHTLMANAFFCTFPMRGKNQFPNYPSINFSTLFSSSLTNNYGGDKAKVEKLKCIISYFDQMRSYDETQNKTIIFTKKAVNWNYNLDMSERVNKCNLNLRDPIERALGMMQVNFGNKYIGGGVLNNGSIMEEIRFATCPELIIARLFTRKLEDNEVLVVYLFEKFSNYDGYGRSFKYVPLDKPYRDIFSLICMDAYDFSKMNENEQFTKRYLDRELKKCICAFRTTNNESQYFQNIASGKWGCGDFKGNAQLKSLIQIMAATNENKSLWLHLFGDNRLYGEIDQFQSYLNKPQCTIGFLYNSILEYGSSWKFTRGTLYEFIISKLEPVVIPIYKLTINNMFPDLLRLSLRESIHSHEESSPRNASPFQSWHCSFHIYYI